MVGASPRQLSNAAILEHGVSLWELPNRIRAGLNTDIKISRIAAGYPGRSPRSSLRAVADLRRRLPDHDEPPVIAVVGTNGKTSTATYLARLLTMAGVRTGRYTSPHLSSWGERVAIDGVPSDEGELVAALEEVSELADGAGVEGGELRFFDVLTLAAELLFARHAVELAVYEAGIGGRLDAVKLLEPRLTLLTGIARDHVEILGPDLEQILREKLLVAPPGGTVLSLPLPPRLGAAAHSIASEAGIELVWLEEGAERMPASAAGLSAGLRRSLALALRGGELAGEVLGVKLPQALEQAEIDLAVPGRYEHGQHDGVAYVLDSAHNEAAWEELVAELGRGTNGEEDPLVAVVSLSPDKDRGALARMLGSVGRLDSVVATRHLELPAIEPEELAAELRRAGVETEVGQDPAEGVSLAFERARKVGGAVVVFGSTHLAGEARRLLDRP
jgi:dihydrofolate synthase/folylpolyglutamate synthase